MDIVSCRKYEDLPDRIIVSREPLTKKPKYSFGTIVKCKDYYLLVQRRVSIEFQNIIRGTYRKSELISFIKKISVAENELLSRCCEFGNFESVYTFVVGKIKKVEVVESGNSTSPKRSPGPSPKRSPTRVERKLVISDKNYDFAKIRFEENKKLIILLLDEPCMFETEYFWPKGRNTMKESWYDTAVRETFEETGLDISGYRKFDYIEDRYTGTDNNIYVNCLWMINLEEKDWWRNGPSPKREITELPIVTNEHSRIEISNVKWVHKDELIYYLRPEKMFTIEKYL